MNDIYGDTPDRKSSRTRLVAAVVALGVASTLAGVAAFVTLRDDNSGFKLDTVRDVSPLGATPTGSPASKPPSSLAPVTPASKSPLKPTATSAATTKASTPPSCCTGSIGADYDPLKYSRPGATQIGSPTPTPKPTATQPAPAPKPTATQPAPKPTATSGGSSYPALRSPSGGYNHDIACRRSGNEIIYTYSFTYSGVFWLAGETLPSGSDGRTKRAVGYNGASDTLTVTVTSSTDGVSSGGDGYGGQNGGGTLFVRYSKPSASGDAASAARKQFDASFTYPSC